MKASKTLGAVALALSLTMPALSQESIKNTLFSVGSHDVRVSAGAALKLSSIRSDAAGYVDVNATATVDESWTIGLGASGLYYDKKLTALVPDGTYHLYVGYAGLVVGKIFPLSSDLAISASLLMGAGEAYYRYDREYRKGKLWYQETIDRKEIFVTEPSMTVEYRISNHVWLGLTGSYRSTSPLNLIGAPEGLLRTFAGGMSVKYDVF